MRAPSETGLGPKCALAVLGRNCVPAYALGHGKDAPRKPKSKKERNAAWRARNAARQLSGTPFYGLGLAANDDRRRA